MEPVAAQTHFICMILYKIDVSKDADALLLTLHLPTSYKIHRSRAYCYGPMTGYIKPNLSNSLLDSLLSLDFLKVLCFSFPVPLNSRS